MEIKQAGSDERRKVFNTSRPQDAGVANEHLSNRKLRMRHREPADEEQQQRRLKHKVNNEANEVNIAEGSAADGSQSRRGLKQAIQMQIAENQVMAKRRRLNEAQAGVIRKNLEGQVQGDNVEVQGSTFEPSFLHVVSTSTSRINKLESNAMARLISVGRRAPKQDMSRGRPVLE